MGSLTAESSISKFLNPPLIPPVTKALWNPKIPAGRTCGARPQLTRTSPLSRRKDIASVAYGNFLGDINDFTFSDKERKHVFNALDDSETDRSDLEMALKRREVELEL